MFYPPPHFFQQLEERLRALEENYQQLEEEYKRLQEQIKEIKPIHIENMNYKIQELVVKELSGTLNIGLSGLMDPEELAKWHAKEREQQDVHLANLEQREEETIPVQPEQEQDEEDVYG